MSAENAFTAISSRVPFRISKPSPEKPGMLVKIDEVGTRPRGRFVNREFVPSSEPACKAMPVVSIEPL